VIRPIRLLGDPVLRSGTRIVERFDDELAALIDDLVETMYHADGIGLAAPQVGDERRVTVIDVGERRDGSEVIELVNPRILSSSGTIPSEEGCLSIPGLVETIERAAEVEVEYRNRSGATLSIRGTDLLGRALQHEIDHLEGTLFIDYLGSLQRRIVVQEWKKAMEAKGVAVGDG